MITEVKDLNNIKIIYLNDEIYSNKNNNEFEILSSELLETLLGDHVNFILNFKNTSFINSTMLGEILKMYKSVKKSNGELVLCNLCSDIANLFEITKINTLIKIFENEDLAIQHLSVH